MRPERIPVANPGKEPLCTVPELGTAVIAFADGPMSTQAVSVWLLLASVSEYFGCTIRSTNNREAFVLPFDDAVFQREYWPEVRSEPHNTGAKDCTDSQLWSQIESKVWAESTVGKTSVLYGGTINEMRR